MTKEVPVSREALGALVRARRLKVGRVATIATVGFVFRTAGLMAGSGLDKAARSSAGAPSIQFPPRCCNCMTEAGVRPIDSRSVVNQAVAYEFRLPVPHCPGCADTANRKRPGVMGLVAAFFLVSVPLGIVLLAFGAASNRDWMITSSFVVAPLAGFAVPYAWTKVRRPRAGQASRHQAVYPSGVDVDVSGNPRGFTLAFENPSYARQFLDLNRETGTVRA